MDTNLFYEFSLLSSASPEATGSDASVQNNTVTLISVSPPSDRRVFGLTV